MENVRLVTEIISSYVFTFVIKLNWINNTLRENCPNTEFFLVRIETLLTLLKLRAAQWDSASTPNHQVPDLNLTDTLRWLLGTNYVTRLPFILGPVKIMRCN